MLKRYFLVVDETKYELPLAPPQSDFLSAKLILERNYGNGRIRVVYFDEKIPDSEADDK